MSMTSTLYRNTLNYDDINGYHYYNINTGELDQEEALIE